MNDNVQPGIHPGAQAVIDKKFHKTEKRIAKYWSYEWYITHANYIEFGQSEYRFFVVKPTNSYAEALGLSREVLIVLSDYPEFEPRSLEIVEEIFRLFQDNRLESICYVLISADSSVDSHIKECLSNRESRVIIPFAYGDFDAHRGEQHFIRNQFRNNFFSRDLFDFSEPLKQDYYFFGRSELSAKIIDKHRANQNYGLFGLRKAGKTSIIYDVMRKLPQTESIGVLIDCQNPSFNKRRWNEALYYVLMKTYEQAGLELPNLENSFTETDASYLFEEWMKKASNQISKTILLFFDEIENITFDKSGVSHWCDELDFVYFWQSLRSSYQNIENVFTFCICGTNPRCVETPTIQGKDNPIFNAFQPYYIPGFDYKRTREMVRKLGKLMGIHFEEGIYSRLTEDYGGHPFLIRQLCSAIAQNYTERPVTIDRNRYSRIKETFNRENNYFHMLLEVLQQFYEDEYEMLEILASEEMETFRFYAEADYSMVKHLIGYGIIRQTEDDYEFQIDALKEYLIRQKKKRSPVKSKEEKWSYICVERGTLEIDLRKMVKTILQIAYKSEAAAKEAVIKKYMVRKKQNILYTHMPICLIRGNHIFISKI